MNADGTKTSKSELSSLPITSSHKALAKRIFGKKMRSVIKQASAAGIDTIVNQQFEFAAPIVAAGLVPIVELEVDIHCPERARAETLLKAAILKKLGALPSGQLVTLTAALMRCSGRVKPRDGRGRCWKRASDVSAALQHGPYPTPLIVKCYRIVCGVRGVVRIVGLSTAAIPWPTGERDGEQALVVYRGLARALGSEAAGAIAAA